jgi:Reverse transcriptase (RNA-dependent DNA polymerase)
MSIMSFFMMIYKRKYICLSLPGSSTPLIPLMYPHQSALWHQALCTWFYKLITSLLTLGFLASKSDPSLFFLHTSTSITLVLIYIDDILITSSDQFSIHNLISSLSSCFSLKVLDSLHYFWAFKFTLILTTFTFLN